jgi:hypothetical protein
MSGRSRSAPRRLSPGRSRRSPARSRRLARGAVAAGLALASALIAVGGCKRDAAGGQRPPRDRGELLR